jgi:type II secretory pathway pseudopilin PulG
LLVVVFIIALLVTLLAPSLIRAQQLAWRAACQGHLKAIGTGAQQYATNNETWFPVVSAESVTNVTDVGKNPETAPNDLAGTTCQSRAWYLTVRMRMTQFGHFACPEDGEVSQEKNLDTEVLYDFPGNASGPPISYAFQTCLVPAAADPPLWLPRSRSPGEFAVAGDMNGLMEWKEGGTDGAHTWWYADASDATDLVEDANGAVHLGGQNVLYASASVEWSPTPECGVNKDNVYTSQEGEGTAPSRSGKPADRYDNLLMP